MRHRGSLNRQQPVVYTSVTSYMKRFLQNGVASCYSTFSNLGINSLVSNVNFTSTSRDSGTNTVTSCENSHRLRGSQMWICDMQNRPPIPGLNPDPSIPTALACDRYKIQNIENAANLQAPVAWGSVGRPLCPSTAVLGGLGTR